MSLSKLASLAKWLSVCLRTKWLWVRVLLHSHYNLSLEVLSNEYEQSSTYHVLSELFAEVSSRRQ